jgi:hypothetical protein
VADWTALERIAKALETIAKEMADAGRARRLAGLVENQRPVEWVDENPPTDDQREGYKLPCEAASAPVADEHS